MKPYKSINMASKFSQTANDSIVKTTNYEIRVSKPLNAQRVAQLIAQDVKEILAEKQKNVSPQQ